MQNNAYVMQHILSFNIFGKNYTIKRLEIKFSDQNSSLLVYKINIKCIKRKLLENSLDPKLLKLRENIIILSDSEFVLFS